MSALCHATLHRRPCHAHSCIFIVCFDWCVHCTPTIMSHRYAACSAAHDSGQISSGVHTHIKCGVVFVEQGVAGHPVHGTPIHAVPCYSVRRRVLGYTASVCRPLGNQDNAEHPHASACWQQRTLPFHDPCSKQTIRSKLTTYKQITQYHK